VVFLPSRTRTPGRHLEWRLRLFTIGALLGLGGMVMRERLLVWIAMAVLIVAFGLRFLPSHEEVADAPDEDASGP
jgi:hypothetical protein